VVGFGSENAHIYFYIENIPPLPQYQKLQTIQSLLQGDIAYIANATGNHWRKIFNVMAKVVFELEQFDYPTWQTLRDDALLQKNSPYCLSFTPPISNTLDDNKVHIILGKTYATKLGYADKCYWLTPHFAINEKEQIIICPYFDYRQLSNIKITQLVQLIKPLSQLALSTPTEKIRTKGKKYSCHAT